MNLRISSIPGRPAVLALLLSLALAACATGEAGSEPEGDAAPATDTPMVSTGDVPTFDLVSPLDDLGEVDAGAPEDAGAPDTGAPDVGAPEDAGVPDVGFPDVGAPDSGTIDAGVADAGGCMTSGETLCAGGCVDLQRDVRNCGSCGRACGEVEVCTSGRCAASCVAPRALCGAGATMRCVDMQTDAQNCGRCGMACAAGSACTAGRCATATCMTNASDCNSSSADGCEVIHGTAPNTCPAAEDLGSYCGDTACGFLCPGRSLRTVATRTGNRSHWYRGRLNECSSCPASLSARLALRVPAGVDYDLFVYSACGRLIGSSQALAGVTDQFTLSGGGDFGSDSFDFYVEVRWFSGASCLPFTLTFEARSASATSC